MPPYRRCQCLVLWGYELCCRCPCLPSLSPSALHAITPRQAPPGSSVWMPECTFWGEFFKLTHKQVCLVGLLYITLTAGITMTDSSLWNFYSHFNTSDEVQCYLPALLFPLCNHLWRQNSPGRMRSCSLISHCPQKIMCDFWPLNPYYQMDPALMWKSKYKVYLTNSRV